MRILVLGASGMLGHKLVQVFAAEYETVAAIRRPDSCPFNFGPGARGASRIVCVEANDPYSIVRVSTGSSQRWCSMGSASSSR